jgi:hypothetical protein
MSAIFVKAGETTTKNLVVRGERPFEILDIRSSDSRLQFAWPRKPASLHLVAVTFAAGPSPERIQAKVGVKTSGAGQPVVGLPIEIHVQPKS